MKKLLLVICGLVVMGACGGGSGGGGGGGGTPPPPALSVSISPSTQSNIDQGQTEKFTASVENDSSSKGVSWSCSATGLTGTACGTFSNTSTSAVTYNAPASVPANTSITVTATSITDPSKTSSAVVMVYPPPRITTTTLSNATPNANYNATLQATGGIGTLTWTMESGTLPTGLSLSGSGAITGDPTVAGTSTFTVQVTDQSAAPGGPGSAQARLGITVVTHVSISTTSLPAGSEGITYLAEIDAGGGTPPYTWTLTSGSLPPGLAMQAGSGVIFGSPTTQGTYNFIVAAKDSSPTQQTRTKPLTLAIGAPGPLTITTTSLLDGTLNTLYHAKVVAVGGMPPYTWTVAAGFLPANVSLDSSTGALAGTPSSAGTAHFTVIATDASSTHETMSQALSLTVDDAAEACASSGNAAVLSGAYVFSLSGFNDVGFLTVVGSFTADGTGRITAGEADTNGVLGAQNGSLITSASSYSVGQDNRGCATLATPFGTFVTRFALGSISSNTATRGRLIEWDSPSASAYIASGEFLHQSSNLPAVKLSGGYVFRTVGWDPLPLGGRDVCVGVLSASGNMFNGLEEDCNDAWNLTNVAAPEVAGTYTTLDGNGRGTGIIAVGQSNLNLTFYMVSPAQLLMVNADPGPAASGELTQQTVPAGGNFSPASLNGNLVFYLNGLTLTGTASTISVETVSADGSSSLAINFYEDRAGVMQAAGSYTCTYAVEANGRVTLSSSTQDCGGNPPVFYLTGLNAGAVLDSAPGVDTGSLEPQSAGPFNNASLSGSFFGGMAEVVTQGVRAEVDPIVPSGSGIMTGITDSSSTSAQDTGAPFLAATYTVNPDGTFSVSSSGGAVAGIIISARKFVMFSPTTLPTSFPTLLVVQK